VSRCVVVLLLCCHVVFVDAFVDAIATAFMLTLAFAFTIAFAFVFASPSEVRVQQFWSIGREIEAGYILWGREFNSRRGFGG